MLASCITHKCGEETDWNRTNFVTTDLGPVEDEKKTKEYDRNCTTSPRQIQL